LIEILIVIILLGIMATIIIPQVSVSNEDTKINALKTNLRLMRGAIRLYSLQHGNIYPGANDKTGNPAANIGLAQEAFIAQLTLYTNAKGVVYPLKVGLYGETYEFGPYLKSSELPPNPFNSDNGVLCDITTADITTKVSDGSSGWKFYTKTGLFMANDGSNDNL